MSEQPDEDPPRLPNGQFQKGYVPKVRRKKGTPNKVTNSARAMLENACAAAGGGSVEGLLAKVKPDILASYWIQANVPKASAKDAESDGSGAAPVFHIVPIQSNRFISLDGTELLSEAQERARLGLPLLREPDAPTINETAVEIEGVLPFPPPPIDGGGSAPAAA